MKKQNQHHVQNIESANSIPSWLATPPTSPITPPVLTSIQELPFEKLSWENFEKLCVRLAKLESNVEHCQLYGERGQKQQGIDIYARQKAAEKYVVYQCKRVKNFGPPKIKKAVTEFLKGNWVDKTETLILCTQESLSFTDRADMLEGQATRLRVKNVTLLPWDSYRLSEKLKVQPKIVDDFFGREWVKAFCGEEDARKLGARLDVGQVAEFRTKFRAFYQHVFNQHDPGILVGQLIATEVLPIESRYVLPDINEQRSITIQKSEDDAEADSPEEGLNEILIGDGTYERSQRQVRSPRQVVAYQQRHPLEYWLTSYPRSVVLGGPGSGKSSLLRFLAVDLLQESPRLTAVAQAWGEYLPVWVPFALWTKIISESTLNDSSLGDLLRKWLKSWDEETLCPLVDKALEDERLLLLIDGLDEWTSEQAAKIGIQRLQVFIGQRNIPAVVVSRPTGFDRLGMQTAGWKLGELSDLSVTQQKELSRKWFAFRAKATSVGGSYEEVEADRKVELETDTFLAELHGSPDLRELAKVPLLLCLLISHRFFNARLPQSRFKAYDSLIEHLISTHPKRRKTAAFITDSSTDLSEDEVKKVLASLAYHAQENFGEGLIEQSEAIAHVEEYLRDKEYGFDLDAREARQYSRQVLEVGENTIGLLVRKSPTEIAYFHRVFQEYLAAYHLSSLPLNKQLEVVQAYCSHPQWREVLLCLFHIANSAERINQYIDRIKSKPANPIERYDTDLLLGETAFTNSKISAGVAKELAQAAFEEIEFGTWTRQREQLLHFVLEGLRTTRMREIVKAKLRSWFPHRIGYQQERLFAQMSEWPLSTEVIECLWRGIHSENTSSQRAATKALAKLTAGDYEVGNRMATLAASTQDYRIRASAIEGLLLGWPSHDKVTPIIQNARNSVSPELRLNGILGKIHYQQQTEEDLVDLLHLGSSTIGLDYYWRQEVAHALQKGWPASPKVKEACFSAIKNRDNAQLEREMALDILISGYHQDDDVAQYCATELKTEKYPFAAAFLDFWHKLAKNFRDHPLLVKAIDEWLPNQSHDDTHVAIAALVGRTATAKAKLLSSLDAHFLHWPVGSLLEGWGMSDPEVSEPLIRIAFGPPEKASKIAHDLPHIIHDKVVCRRRLVELLKDPKCQRFDMVMHGLDLLGDTQGDREVVDAVFSLDLKRDSWLHENVISYLIHNYSSDERVKDLALQEFLERGGHFAAIAAAYRDDETIRQKLIDTACPLPATFRREIAAYLGEGGDDSFALSLLKLYDHDPDEEVKVQASINYHKRLKLSGVDTTAAVEVLSRDIVSYGPDLEERRQAAFSGLLALGRLDVMLRTEETIGEDKRCRIKLSKVSTPNIPLIRFVLQHWEYIKLEFGDEIWYRLGKHSENEAVYNELSVFADEYPVPRDEILRLINPHQLKYSNLLRFLSRMRPKSDLLLEACFSALDSTQHWDSVGTVAAEILGVHFGGDSKVLERVMSNKDKDHLNNDVITALCEGWPDSAELEYVFERLKEDSRRVRWPLYFHVTSRKSSSEIVANALVNFLLGCERDHYMRNSVVTRPILRRLRSDDTFLNLLSKRLLHDPKPSEKATIPRLIGAARGISSELREWCLGEAEYQSKADSPEMGFDLMSSEVRPVIHSLFDVLRVK